MKSAMEVYKENFGHSHESAVGSVYAAGFADGVASVTPEAPVAEALAPEAPVEAPKESEL